jgi:hypothetical protein
MSQLKGPNGVRLKWAGGRPIDPVGSVNVTSPKRRPERVKQSKWCADSESGLWFRKVHTLSRRTAGSRVLVATYCVAGWPTFEATWGDYSTTSDSGGGDDERLWVTAAVQTTRASRIIEGARIDDHNGLATIWLALASRSNTQGFEQRNRVCYAN